MHCIHHYLFYSFLSGHYKDVLYIFFPFVQGSWSCLYFTILLNRFVEYYIIQVYVPSVMVVILSWLSFWIDTDAVPARISLGLLTVLTITTQTSGISSKLPKQVFYFIMSAIIYCMHYTL